MISDETIERVREAADIVQIIGEHVALRRTGADFRGPCPFHQGTKRNFSVSPRKGIYYCFVCHEGGDVFTFLQKQLGMEWPAAVRYVAERCGIPVEEEQRRREGADPRQPLWDLNAAVADYFRTTLWGGEEGRAARDYLTLRRVTREVADRFGLGFAPRDPDALRAHFTALGFDDERLLEAALLVRREEGGEPRARFRNRLMFPIYDASGNCVGFGGRLLGPGEPKYLNSAESPVFAKSSLLYGLHMARHVIRRDDRAMLVEGYFDVVRLVSAGFDWVVAPLGTALTEQQATLLRRYTRNAFLLYDSDAAGLKATFRAGDLLLRHGMAVQVVTLPEGEDPDSFVDRYGGEKLAAQLGAAVDVFERKIQLLQRAGWFGDLRRKRRALDRLLPTLRAVQDPITRDLYLSRTSEVAGISRDVLVRELHDGSDDAGAPEHAGPAAQPAAPAGRRRAAGTRAATGPTGFEREFLRILVHEPEHLEAIASRVQASELDHPAAREIYTQLIAGLPHPEPDAIAASLSDAARGVLEELVASPWGEGYVVQPALEGSIARLHDRAIARRQREIPREVAIATTESEKNERLRDMVETQQSRMAARGARPPERDRD